MKYVVLNDIDSIIKKDKLIIISYYLITLLIMILYVYFSYTPDDKLFESILSLRCNFRNLNWLEMLVFIFNISIYIFITLKLFTNDMKSNLENIFLRISTHRWLLIKLCSIKLITFIILLINYLIISIFLYLTRLVYNPVIIIMFLKNIIYVYISEMLVLLIYSLLNYNYFGCLIMFGLIFIVMLFPNITSILSINNAVLIFLWIILEFLVILLIKNKLKIIFEKVKEK